MCLLVGQRRCALGRSCDAADASLSSECFNWGGFELSCFHPQGFVLATLQLLDAGRRGPRLPRLLLRGEGSEHSASGSRLCRDALDVWAEDEQPVQ